MTALRLSYKLHALWPSLFECLPRYSNLTAFNLVFLGLLVSSEAVRANPLLPVAADVRGSAGLFGLTASLPDGTNYRGVEYVDRSVSMWEAAGRAVAKIQGETAEVTG